ncbi:MAG TPA: fumarylacetoacetate hydrolase family protein [Saprospiraceae bacterium]|nr:fumarylacetoacetate hydrolase family protein [Saprospiraceae bacterium]
MKIICVGRNYVAHAAELGNEIPDSPMLFMKPHSAILANNKPLYYPDFTNDLNYEAELVLKICKNGRSIQPEFADSYYQQVGFGIDFTARDLQQKCKEKGHPWEIAKAWDNSAALSNDFINVSSLPNPAAIKFEMNLNGKVVQQGDSSLMIYSFNDIICYASRFFKLQVGDYIYTGTPAGVGPVKKGDILIGSIEGRQMLTCAIK